DQFRRDSAVAAFGHILLGEAARADIPEGQPRKPVLLRDLGLPRGFSRSQRFAFARRRARSAGAQYRALGRLLSAPQERLEDQELVRLQRSSWPMHYGLAW